MGAGRVPWIVFGVVVVLVVASLVIGFLGGWILALLVPVGAFTLYVAVRVLLVLFGPRPS